MEKEKIILAYLGGLDTLIIKKKDTLIIKKIY